MGNIDPIKHTEDKTSAIRSNLLSSKPDTLNEAISSLRNFVVKEKNAASLKGRVKKNHGEKSKKQRKVTKLFHKLFHKHKS